MSAVEEIWKPIPIEPFSEDYAVSSLGRIKRTRKSKKNGIPAGHILSPFEDKKGYLYIQLRKEYYMKRFPIHKLVALAFIGPCPEGKEIDHEDRVKSNNEYTNLRYLTHQENIARTWVYTLIR